MAQRITGKVRALPTALPAPIDTRQRRRAAARAAAKRQRSADKLAARKAKVRRRNLHE